MVWSSVVLGTNQEDGVPELTTSMVPSLSIQARNLIRVPMLVLPTDVWVVGQLVVPGLSGVYEMDKNGGQILSLRLASRG